MLRSEHPEAHVFASNFDDFFAQAEDERHLLPIVRQEIGDTWLYGIPTGRYQTLSEHNSTALDSLYADNCLRSP